MNQLIDIHVLLLPTTHPAWWKECRESLEGEPVNLHLVEGVAGHIGKGRAKGFALGTAPYVSCVDPDDLVVAGAFQALPGGFGISSRSMRSLYGSTPY